MLATYTGGMRNNNLEITIAGSSCRPKLYTCSMFKFLYYIAILMNHFDLVY